MEPVEEDKTSGRKRPPHPLSAPIREEKRETWGKCSISGFSGTAASSRMSEPTPNPSRIHTARVHTAESDERSSRRGDEIQPSPDAIREAVLCQQAMTVRPSLRPSQLGPKCSWVCGLAFRRVPWLPYWEPSSR